MAKHKPAKTEKSAGLILAANGGEAVDGSNMRDGAPRTDVRITARPVNENTPLPSWADVLLMFLTKGDVSKVRRRIIRDCAYIARHGTWLVNPYLVSQIIPRRVIMVGFLWSISHLFR